MTATSLPDRSVRTAAGAFALAAAMVGLGFASVPLYDLFCRVTGFGGTTQRYDAAADAQAPKVLDQQINVRFDANVSRDLPWKFRPEEVRHRVHIGERNMAVYLAENMTARPIKGIASFNVTPSSAGRYFSKIECFCFVEQILAPGEKVRMPVLFFVDPAIMDDPDARDIQEITLSYTFYPVDEG